MTKFKAGDTVRCVTKDRDDIIYGEEYTVIWVADGIVSVGNRTPYRQSRFRKALPGLKVGDKVRRVGAVTGVDHYAGMKVGGIYTVAEFSGDGILLEGIQAGWDEYKFEIVREPAFNVGDRVICVDSGVNNEFGLEEGKEYTVTKHYCSREGTEYISVSGGVAAFYTSRFTLVKPEPKFKVGDRVSITYENTITSISDYEIAYFRHGSRTLAAPVSALTKLSNPLPAKSRTVILLDSPAYGAMQLIGSHWHEAGADVIFSVDEAQVLADKYGFTVIHEGEESW